MLFSDLVSPEIERDADNLPILKKYKSTSNGKIIRYDPEQIAHIRYWSGQENPFIGLSPIAIAKDLIEAVVESDIELRNAYQSSGATKLISAKNEGSFQQKWADVLRARLQQLFGNSQKRHETPPMIGSAVEVNKIGDTVTELGLLESNPILFERVCRIWGYPPALLSSKASTLDNMKVADRMLITQCVLPAMRRINDTLTVHIAKKQRPELIVVSDKTKIDSLRESPTDKAKRLAILGGYTYNEARRDNGLEERPEDYLDRP